MKMRQNTQQYFLRKVFDIIVCSISYSDAEESYHVVAHSSGERIERYFVAHYTVSLYMLWMETRHRATLQACAKPPFASIKSFDPFDNGRECPKTDLPIRLACIARSWARHASGRFVE